MKLVIWERTAINWSSMDMDAFFKQENKIFKRYEELLRFCIPVWNETFHLEYPQFRAELQLIANENRGNLPGVDEIIRGESDFAQYIDSAADDTIIVPVDDDDWFAPDLVRLKTIFEQGKFRYVIWPQLIIGPNRKDYMYRVLKVPEQDIPESNNFAFTVGMFKEYDYKEIEVILPYHMSLGRKFLTLNKPVHIPGWFSVYCKTVASISFMGTRRKECPEESETDFSLFLKNVVCSNLKQGLTQIERKSEYVWAFKYLERVFELYSRLVVNQ